LIRIAIALLLLLLPLLARAADPSDQAHGAALQAALVALQAPPDTASDIAAQLRDWLTSFAALAIPALIGLGLRWANAHMAIMREVGMNSAITDSASRLGGLLVNYVQAEGRSVHTLTAQDPTVTSLAGTLITRYPGYSAALGLTPEKAAATIIGEAAKLLAQSPGVVSVRPGPPMRPLPIAVTNAT
jgi:hypothetical protein